MISNKAYELARSVGWTPKNEEIDAWQVDALDPLFFQALGKALGWATYAHRSDSVDVPKFEWDYLRDISQYTWEYHAHRFYDLILTGGDTDKFWQEILK